MKFFLLTALIIVIVIFSFLYFSKKETFNNFQSINFQKIGQGSANIWKDRIKPLIDKAGEEKGPELEKEKEELKQEFSKFNNFLWEKLKDLILKRKREKEEI